MEIHLLDAYTDSQTWRATLARLPKSIQDVYFWPEYVRLDHHAPGARPVLFDYQRGEHTWVYPFLLGSISQIGSRPLNRLWYDLESPYGYSGPLSDTDDPSFLADAHQAFATWCQENDVIAEFIRLHPLLDNQRWLDSDIELIFDRQTVSLDLKRLIEDRPPFSKNARYALRQADRAGIRTSLEPPQKQIAHFSTRYCQTMGRLKAGQYYYFSEQYFHELAQLAERAGLLLAAEVTGKWIAGAVFLYGSRWLHYHLSASDPDKTLPGATNQIIYVAAKLGQKSGLEYLHLGGGRTCNPDDSLLKFKLSMATESHKFYIGKRIHNPEVYESLKDQWSSTYPELVEKFGNRLLCYRYEKA
jgi:hypothetical protein